MGFLSPLPGAGALLAPGIKKREQTTGVGARELGHDSGGPLQPATADQTIVGSVAEMKHLILQQAPHAPSPANGGHLGNVVD